MFGPFRAATIPYKLSEVYNNTVGGYASIAVDAGATRTVIRDNNISNPSIVNDQGSGSSVSNNDESAPGALGDVGTRNCR